MVNYYFGWQPLNRCTTITSGTMTPKKPKPIIPIPKIPGVKTVGKAVGGLLTALNPTNIIVEGATIVFTIPKHMLDEMISLTSSQKVPVKKITVEKGQVQVQMEKDTLAATDTGEQVIEVEHKVGEQKVSVKVPQKEASSTVNVLENLSVKSQQAKGKRLGRRTQYYQDDEGDESDVERYFGQSGS